MRRSICYCEPNMALAGDTSTWRFIYTTASQLPKGTKLRFDLQSKGRPADWQVPHTNLKEKKADHSGVIKAILVESGQAVEFGQPLFIIG